MCKEYHKVKDKGSEETTAFHLPGNPPVNGCSSYFARVMPNTDYRLQISAGFLFLLLINIRLVRDNGEEAIKTRIKYINFI